MMGKASHSFYPLALGKQGNFQTSDVTHVTNLLPGHDAATTRASGSSALGFATHAHA